MSKHSFEEDLKPKSVFVEDAEAAQADLGSYSRNVNARYDQVTLIAEEYVRANEKLTGRISNPLAGIAKVDLYDRVLRFCQEFGFEDHIETFQKGALVAQNPNTFEDLSELTEEDKYHLRREYTHKWHLPKALYFSIGLCSLGSAIQGWDNTGANGANLSFPQEFGIEDNAWLVGVINSGAWASDPLNNWLGRRGTIFVTGLFCVFPVLAQGFTQNWWGLMLCRLFMGLGMGVKISTIPVFSAEVSPASIRGGLVTSFQLWVAFGILVGFCSNLVFYRIGALAWRFQLSAAFAPAIPVLIFVWFCPESPRWLMKKYRYKDAFMSFCRLRNTELIAARELYYAHCQVVTERDAFSGESLAHRVWELFTVPRLRRAMISSAIVVTSQQFSGINIMSFYSSTIFSEAGYSTRDCLLASLGFGLVTFVFALPAVFTMDTFGRRNLLLFTFPNMAWCLLAAGCCFLLPTGSEARVPLIAFFVYLFSAFYGPGIGPIASIYFSEAFPLSHRELGAAFTICVNNSIGSALSLTFPSLLKKTTPTGAFGFYAGLNILAFLIIFLVVPETKQRTLEELDYTFGVPISRHARYQTRTWLPCLTSKTPILFLHGFGSCKEDLADVHIHPYLKQYGYIAYDAPGCGHTKSDTLSATDIPFLVATAEAFLEHFKLTRFHLMGHSMGGLTALYLAHRNPDRVLSFVDIKGNLAPEDCFLSRQIFTFKSDDPEDFFNAFIDRTRTSGSFGSALYASTLRARVRVEAVRPIFESMVQLSDEADLLGMFMGLPFPRMFMFGWEMRGLSYLEELKKGGVELAQIEECGHFPMYSSPLEMYRQMSIFLDMIGRN
ncbi:hypothetical protein N7481_008101 [Penicillium waksmanii]|uniref:uncharacterized protein n=1 Tax=Penicillium waksmanii TaxID=69791 RepID=UPI002548FFBF|nr:uncharacterized protein N7481_008101 [Penicillium waksmanii]KAJ5980803.1 hypothetical protein N7481_008101 [Penicillium waksmanii]